MCEEHVHVHRNLAPSPPCDMLCASVRPRPDCMGLRGCNGGRQHRGRWQERGARGSRRGARGRGLKRRVSGSAPGATLPRLGSGGGRRDTRVCKCIKEGLFSRVARLQLWHATPTTQSTSPRGRSARKRPSTDSQQGPPLQAAHAEQQPCLCRPKQAQVRLIPWPCVLAGRQPSACLRRSHPWCLQRPAAREETQAEFKA